MQRFKFLSLGLLLVAVLSLLGCATVPPPTIYGPTVYIDVDDTPREITLDRGQRLILQRSAAACCSTVSVSSRTLDKRAGDVLEVMTNKSNYFGTQPGTYLVAPYRAIRAGSAEIILEFRAPDNTVTRTIRITVINRERI
jgi:hypothetical protein